MGQTIEYRAVAPQEIRTDAEAGGFDGYASTWGAVDSYGTALARGAFKKSLRERGDRVPVLFQHNPDWVIGSPTTLREDDRGLYHETRLFDDGGTVPGTGSVALAQLRQGARFGMSFGFNTINDRAAKPGDNLDYSQMPELTPSDVRVITEVRLWEISLVTFPANEQAAPTSVRGTDDAVTVAALIEALRSGTLTDEQADLLDTLFAAWQTRTAEPVPDAPLTDPEQPTTRRAYTTELLWLSALRAA